MNGLVLPTGTPIVQTNYIMGAFDFTNNRAGELIQTETMGKMSSIKVIVDYKEVRFFKFKFKFNVGLFYVKIHITN